jgi:hypothetical protein
MAVGTNYLTTFAQVTAKGLTLRSVYPYASNKIVTKQNLIDYYFVDTSYLSGYASNQCVMYQDIQALPQYTVSFFGRKSTNPGTFYAYYSIDSPTMATPVLLNPAITRTGVTLDTVSGIFSGETITVAVSDVNGPNNSGIKPTTAQVGSYPAFATACTGYVTFTITSNVSIYISGTTDYIGWC